MNPRWSRCLNLCALTVALMLPSRIIAQPLNDNCADAILVTNGDYNGSSIGSTGDAASMGCPSGSFGSDVWYRFHAPYNGLLLVSTCQGANFDTILAVWNGCPANDGVELACSDDICPVRLSSLGVDITVGQDYWIRVAGFEGDSGSFTLRVDSFAINNPTGPDVVSSDITDVVQFAPVGDVHAYISQAHTCNIGNQPLQWGGTPLMTWNAYRVENGAIEQIGLSWVKHGTFAVPSAGCGPTCQGGGGSTLGAGCRDIYTAEFNGDQSIFGRRSDVNPFTGAYSGASGTCDADTSICKRLQIHEADLDSSLHPDALYFIEMVYVAADDAAANNALNNASYKRVSVGANDDMSAVGVVAQGHPAIEAWREHGLGVNMPDPDVMLATIEVPDDGRFYYGYKVRDMGNGRWRYEYAFYNLNSNRGGRSFNVPVSFGAAVSNVGFHDAFYHSGEPLDNTDWTMTVDANGVTWSSPQTFGQNPNSNALRYGTLYNFRFEANAPPTNSTGSLGLFRPGSPDDLGVPLVAPGVPMGCQPAGDLNADGFVTGADIAHFTNCAVLGSSPGGNCACADMFPDQTIDESDVTLFVSALLGA